MLKIEVVKGPDRGKWFTMAEHATYLGGRADEAYLHLAGDPYVSRRHFELELTGNAVFFRALESANTPRVNGFPIDEDASLATGDVIEVGFTRLKVWWQPSDDDQDATISVDPPTSTPAPEPMPDVALQWDDEDPTEAAMGPSTVQQAQDEDATTILPAAGSSVSEEK